MLASSWAAPHQYSERKMPPTADYSSPPADDVDSGESREPAAKRARVEEEEEEEEGGSSSSSSSSSSSAAGRPAADDDTEEEAQQQQQLRNQDQDQVHPHQPGLDDLHGLPIDRVFSYLDARSLFRLSCLTSRSISEFVTFRHVIWSAVSSGGHARESLGRIVALVKARKIMTPTKFRLLRVMNGRRCERGADCVKFGERCKYGTHDGRRAKKINLARKDFGVFVCGDCTESWRLPDADGKKGKKGGFKKGKKGGDDDDEATKEEKKTYTTEKVCRRGGHGIKSFLSNDRLCRRDQNSSFSPIVWSVPFVDSAGERSGPVLTMSDYRAAAAATIDAAVVATFTETAGGGSGSETMEDAIKERLAVVDEQDAESRSNANDIIRYYEAALAEIAKRKKCDDDATEGRRLALFTKRVGQFENLVKIMDERLAGVPWKGVALEYDLHPDGRKYKTNECVATFKCPLVQDRMKVYTVVPNKGNLSKMIGVANELLGVFNLLWSVGFHDYSFLDEGSAAAAGDTFSADLRRYYRRHVTPAELLQHGRMDDSIYALVKAGRCSEALYRRFESLDTIRTRALKAFISDAAKGVGQGPSCHSSGPAEHDCPTEHDTEAFFVEVCMSKEPLGHVPPEAAASLAKDARRRGLRGDIYEKKFANATGRGFEELWREHHVACLARYQKWISVARDGRADPNAL